MPHPLVTGSQLEQLTIIDVKLDVAEDKVSRVTAEGEIFDGKIVAILNARLRSWATGVGCRRAGLPAARRKASA